MSLKLDAGWMAGVFLALARTGAFAMSSPILAKIPRLGRLALAVGLGLFFSGPVVSSLDLASLVGLMVMNTGVGLTLGYVTGLLFHLFAAAGGMVDLTSGLSISTVLDPATGRQEAVFGRSFELAGTALFLVMGGDRLLVRGLDLSIEAIPLDGKVVFQSGLAGLVVTLTSRLVVAALELALPLMGLLFLTEILLAVATRFAPQANVFLIGLPAKLILALSMAGVVMTGFPGVVTDLQRGIHDAFEDVLSTMWSAP